MAESTSSRYVERQLIIRSDEGDCRAAMAMLEGLPGIRRVCMDPKSRRFFVTFDPNRVSDDELVSALRQHGFELVSWQPAGVRGRGPQREWLLEQIGGLVARAEDELRERGEYAEGLVKGAADAYVRTGRAFGLITDDEVRELIPPRFLEQV
jgi:copper chaperone CopZ